MGNSLQTWYISVWGKGRKQILKEYPFSNIIFTDRTVLSFILFILKSRVCFALFRIFFCFFWEFYVCMQWILIISIFPFPSSSTPCSPSQLPLPNSMVSSSSSSPSFPLNPVSAAHLYLAMVSTGAQITYQCLHFQRKMTYLPIPRLWFLMSSSCC